MQFKFLLLSLFSLVLAGCVSASDKQLGPNAKLVEGNELEVLFGTLVHEAYYFPEGQPDAGFLYEERYYSDGSVKYKDSMFGKIYKGSKRITQNGICLSYADPEAKGGSESCQTWYDDEGVYKATTQNSKSNQVIVVVKRLTIGLPSWER